MSDSEYVGGWPSIETVPVTKLAFPGGTTDFLREDGSFQPVSGGGGSSVPAGVIVMWSGLLATVPASWQLCDGTNGTPDLRARMIVGSAAAVNPGTTGGAATYTPAGTNSAPTFTGTPSSDVVSHTHGFTNVRGAGTGTATTNYSIGTVATDTTSTPVTLATAPNTGGVATVTPVGTVSAPTFTGDVSTTLAIAPLWFALAFIMKL